MVRLTFHGAAGTVSGSKYLLEADGARVLIDCGQFQGLKALRERNWARFPFDVKSLDSVVLTHAHIDHSGMLPRLGRAGFRGPIYATPATHDLVELLLFDAAKTEESLADEANRKGFSKHKPALPLFTSRDVVHVLRGVRNVERGEWCAAAEPIWVRFHDAGHLLGASSVEVEVRQGPRPLRIVFSGDVGRYNAALYHDPAPPPACDFLICESTYGDRDHGDVSVLDELAQVILEAVRRGGVLLVSSFSVGRAQQLIYLLQVLMHEDRIPRLAIYLDSPMAINATNIYADYVDEHDLSEGELSGPDSVFNGPHVHLARTVTESKQLNQVGGPAIIISSAGMMTGGRILHHLRRRLPEPESTILITGFMADGTRGRKLLEGAATLRMHGRDVPVRAAVRQISGLSGHADRRELLRWLAPLERPRRVFLTHGERASAESLAAQLRSTRGWDVVVPELDESVELAAAE